MGGPLRRDRAYNVADPDATTSATLPHQRRDSGADPVGRRRGIGAPGTDIRRDTGAPGRFGAPVSRGGDAVSVAPSATDRGWRDAQLKFAAAVAASESSPALLLRMSTAGRKVRAGWSDLVKLRKLAAVDPDAFDRLSYAVKVADDVVALDLDDPERARDFDQVVQLACLAGATVVLVESGRDGHRHAFIRPRDGAAQELIARKAYQAGIDVRTGKQQRPPLSPHPDGRPISVSVVSGGQANQQLVAEGGCLDEAALTVALAALSPAAAPPSAAPGRSGRGRAPEPGWRRNASAKAPTGVQGAPDRSVGASRTVRRSDLPRLSSAMLHVLRRGDGNPDRSRTLQRVVVAMVNRGWTLEDAWDLLTRPGMRGAEKLNERLARHGADAAYRYLEHCWRSAQRFVEANPATMVSAEDLEALATIQAAADAQRWEGAAGSNAWMVLHCLISIGVRAAGLELTASERQLAEDAALSRMAVHNALVTLQEQGWVTCLRRGSGPKGSLWRLQVPAAARLAMPPTHPTPSLHPLGGVEATGAVLRAGADGWRRKALGTGGYRVLRALQQWGPQTPTQLAERLGLHPGSVGRLLARRLGAVGLVERLGDGTWAAMDVNVAAAVATAAVRFGTEGDGQRQRAWHNRERALYRLTPTWGKDLAFWQEWEASRAGPMAA